MQYEVHMTRSVLKTIGRLPKKVQLHIFTVLEGLKTDPRPMGVKKLKGEENAYRIRVGDYRVIYNLQDKQLCITVVKIGHRQNVYQI